MNESYNVNDYQWEGRTILIAEDIASNYNFLRILLKRSKIEIVWKENGQDALEEVQNNKNIDLVLLDINLPIMNGYDATKRIRSLNTEYSNSLLIYAMTANTFQRDIDKCMEAGMNGHIGKPIEIYRLYSILNTIKEDKLANKNN